MTIRILVLFFAFVSLVSGCGFFHTVSRDNDSYELSEDVPNKPIDQLQSEFIQRDDAGKVLDEMPPLELRVVHFLDSNPLRLGSLGTALTDRYIASLSGQYALQVFYEYLEEPIAQTHRRWVSAIKASMTDDRDGSYSNPYRTLSKNDALVFLKLSGEEPLGVTWEQHPEYHMLVSVLVRNKHRRVSTVYFELESYETITRLFNEPDKVKPIDVLKRMITVHDDDSAKIAYGQTVLMFSSMDGNPRSQRAQGIAFLKPRAGTSNLLSNYYYAKALVGQARAARDERLKSKAYDDAREHFRIVVDAGYDRAMADLGELYITGVFGAEFNQEGVRLLESASALGNHEASFILATFYNVGVIVDEDISKSQSLFVEALNSGDDHQRENVIEYLNRSNEEIPISSSLYEVIYQMARDEHSNAMTMLGRIHALGLYQEPNLRKAKSWYRRAAKVNPTDAETVNEVAWVLSTSKIRGLRQPRYAIKIMNNLMTAVDDARSYAPFIDTWAAAYAADGKFEQAVELQREAIENAKQTSPQEQLIQILEDHLDAFEQSQALDEEVP